MIKANNTTSNIDKLPLEVVGMAHFMFEGKLEGFEDAYMIEIKLDDPIKHIEEGDEFFIIHQSIDQYKSHAEHIWDKDWATIHKDVFKNLAEADKERFQTLLKKYFETGKIAKQKEEKKEYQVRRNRRR